MYPISQPKFDKVIVSQASFKDKGEFLTFCFQNKVDGQPSVIWSLFDFSYTISVYVPHGTKVVYPE